MDKARVVVIAAKMVRGKEKRMKAGAKAINIIWAIIFRGGVVRDRDAYSTLYRVILVVVNFLIRFSCPLPVRCPPAAFSPATDAMFITAACAQPISGAVDTQVVSAPVN